MLFINFPNIVKSCSKRKVWDYIRAVFAKLNDIIVNANWDFIDTNIVHVCGRFTNTVGFYGPMYTVG